MFAASTHNYVLLLAPGDSPGLACMAPNRRGNVARWLKIIFFKTSMISHLILWLQVVYVLYFWRILTIVVNHVVLKLKSSG